MSSTEITILTIACVLVTVLFYFIYPRKNGKRRTKFRETVLQTDKKDESALEKQPDSYDEFIFRVTDTCHLTRSSREKLRELYEGKDEHAGFILIHEPGDRKESDTVRIIHRDGILIGNMESPIRGQIADLLDHNEVFTCQIYRHTPNELWLKGTRISLIPKATKQQFMEQAIGIYEHSLNIEHIDKEIQQQQRKDDPSFSRTC